MCVFEQTQRLQLVSWIDFVSNKYLLIKALTGQKKEVATIMWRKYELLVPLFIVPMILQLRNLQRILLWGIIVVSYQWLVISDHQLLVVVATTSSAGARELQKYLCSYY